MLTRALLLSLAVSLANGVWACELCAIYNADSAASGSGKGFSFAVSEQYIPYGTVQLNGRQLPPSILDQTFVNTSMTHFVPTWSFSKMFSVSLSVPLVHKEFKGMQLTGTGILTESGQETGLGDISLIGRCRVFQAREGMAAITVNLLAGVKFPTGDAEKLNEEVELTRELDAIYGVGHQHSVSGVHLSDLALGSGSYDGVFGLTVNSRWQRLFCNAQFQYYLRTPGEAGYEFGNEWMISGGPGVYLFVHEAFTLSLQTLATYDTSDPDTLLGRPNRNTGMTAIYLGPQLYLTLGERFSANAGVDLPISIDNNGLQNVPDYRLHAGVSFRF
jgi:hypothetical protein